MENLTNQILELGNDQKYFVLRQAAYKGNTYYLAAEITDNEEEFTNNFTFFQRIEGENGNFSVKVVRDQSVLEVLSKNIKLN